MDSNLLGATVSVDSRVAKPWFPLARAAKTVAVPEPAVVLSPSVRAARRWLIFILFASVFLQRFGWASEETGVTFNMFATLLGLGMIFFHGQLTIDPVRAALVLLFSAYAILSLLVNFDRASGSSAALAIVTYGTFAFVLRNGDELFMDCIRVFRSMVLVCAICGIAQYFLQSFISSPFLYTFHGFLPEDILLKGFATYQPLQYESPLSRSNGFFMLEPSIFSQYVALGIIIEMLYFNSKWRICVLVSALIFSYSGTGLIALTVIPGILAGRRSYSILIALAVLGCLAFSMSELLHLDVVAQRSTELSGTETSAHARFVAPGELVSRYLLPYPRDLFFGIGPGTMRDYQKLMPYETHDPVWAKLPLEYGIVGATIFCSMLIFAIFVNSPSMWLSLALAIGFFSFGGELLDSRLQSLLLVFSVLPKREAALASLSMFHPSRSKRTDNSTEAVGLFPDPRRHAP